MMNRQDNFSDLWNVFKKNNVVLHRYKTENNTHHRPDTSSPPHLNVSPTFCTNDPEIFSPVKKNISRTNITEKYDLWKQMLLNHAKHVQTIILSDFLLDKMLTHVF